MDTLEKGSKPQVCESDLEELGFTKAAEGLKQKRALATKMRIAFEHYTVVTPDSIKLFNEELLKRSKTVTDKYGSYTHQFLKFTAIEEYGEIPPPEALQKLREAKAHKCFDRFEVATIGTTSVSKVPDPILFGVITGSDNKYFIAQWDDDVRIEDILRPEQIIN